MLNYSNSNCMNGSQCVSSATASGILDWNSYCSMHSVNRPVHPSQLPPNSFISNSLPLPHCHLNHFQLNPNGFPSMSLHHVMNPQVSENSSTNTECSGSVKRHDFRSKKHNFPKTNPLRRVTLDSGLSQHVTKSTPLPNLERNERNPESTVTIKRQKKSKDNGKLQTPDYSDNISLSISHRIDSENELLLKEIEAKEKSLQTMQSHCRSLQDDLKTSTQIASDYSQQVSRLELQLATKEEIIGSLNRMVSTKNTELERAKAQVEKSKEELKRSQLRGSEIKKQEQLLENYAVVRMELERVSRSLAQTLEEFNENSEILEKAKRENINLRNRMGEMEATMNEYAEQLIFIKQNTEEAFSVQFMEKDKAKNEVEELKAVLTEASKQLKAEQNRNRELGKENESLRSKLVLVIEESNNRNDSVEGEVAEKLTTLMGQLNEAKNQCQSLRSQNQGLVVEMQSLRENLRQQRSQIESMKRENEQLVEKIQRLRAKKAQYKSYLSERNQEMMKAQAASEQNRREQTKEAKEAEKLKIEIADLATKITKKSQKTISMKDQIHKMELLLSENQRKMEESQRENELLREALRKNQEKEKELVKRNENKTQELMKEFGSKEKELQRQNGELKGQLNEALELVEKAQETFCQNEKSEEEELKQRIDSLTIEVTREKLKAKEITMKHASLANELEKCQRESEKLGKALRINQEANSQLEVELDSSVGIISGSKQPYNDSKLIQTQAAELIRELCKEIKSLKVSLEGEKQKSSAMNSIQVEANALKRRLMEENESKKSLDEIFLSMKEQNRQLKEKLVAKETEIEKKMMPKEKSEELLGEVKMLRRKVESLEEAMKEQNETNEIQNGIMQDEKRMRDHENAKMKQECLKTQGEKKALLEELEELRGRHSALELVMEKARASLSIKEKELKCMRETLSLSGDLKSKAEGILKEKVKEELREEVTALVSEEIKERSEKEVRQRVEKALEGPKQEMERLKEIQEIKEERIRRMTEDIEALDKKNQEAEAQLRQNQLNEQKLSEKTRLLEQEIKELHQEREKMMRSLEKKEVVLKGMEEVIAIEKRERLEAENQLKKTQEQFRKSESEQVSSMQERMTEVLVELKENQEVLRKLKMEKEIWEEERSRIQKAKEEQLRAKEEQLNSFKRETEEAIKELSEKYEAVARERNQLKSEIRSINGSQEEEIGRLVKEKERNLDLLDKLKSQYEKTRDSRNEIQEELDKKTEELNEMSQGMKQMQKTLEERNQKLKGLEETLRYKQKEVEQLRGEKEREKPKTTMLVVNEKESEMILNENKTLKEAIKAAGNDVTMLKNELAMIQKRLVSSEEASQKLLDKKDSRIESLERVLEEARVNITELGSQNEEILKENGKMRRQIQEINKQQYQSVLNFGSNTVGVSASSMDTPKFRSGADGKGHLEEQHRIIEQNNLILREKLQELASRLEKETKEKKELKNQVKKLKEKLAAEKTTSEKDVALEKAIQKLNELDMENKELRKEPKSTLAAIQKWLEHNKRDERVAEKLRMLLESKYGVE